MWKAELSENFLRCLKWWQKKQPRELKAVTNNLDTYVGTLNRGVQPLQVKHGFLHKEGCGVFAIDQKGGGTALAQTRLYIFPQAETRIVHLLAIGDKTTQKKDVSDCHDFARRLAKEREDNHGEE